MTSHSISTCLVLIIFIGCGPQDSPSLPGHVADLENVNVYRADAFIQREISLNQAQVFGETDSVLFGQIPDLAVDKSGRVIISEISGGRAAIHLFQPDGSYLASLGNYGDGPGEFRSAINPQIHGDALYVYDGSALRINIYSLQTLSFEGSLQLEPQSWRQIDELAGASPYDFYVLDENRIMLSFLKSVGRRDRVYRYMLTGSGEIVSDKLIEQVLAEHFMGPGNGGVFYSPFSANGLITFTGDNHFYTVWTEDILFKKYTLDGDYVSAFYHPFTNSELSRQEVLDYNEGDTWEASVRHTGFPEAWPAIQSVVSDDSGNIWISTITDSDSSYDWWILTTEGEILATFEWPVNRRIESVTNKSIYAIESDPDTGIQEIVRYEYSFL